jgi:hypothetical protein
LAPGRHASHPARHDASAGDPAESRPYIQTWLGGAEVGEDNTTRVFAAVNKILTAGRVVVAQVVAA